MRRRVESAGSPLARPQGVSQPVAFGAPNGRPMCRVDINASQHGSMVERSLGALKGMTPVGRAKGDHGGAKPSCANAYGTQADAHDHKRGTGSLCLPASVDWKLPNGLCKQLAAPLSLNLRLFLL